MLQRVVRSTVIDAPIERVWAVLRDFNSHDQWHDAVEASRIERHESSDQVGCVRSFSLADGNRIKEVFADLQLRPDGTVSEVKLLPPVPRGWQSYIVSALERWRFEPLPASRVHRVQLVFEER